MFLLKFFKRFFKFLMNPIKFFKDSFNVIKIAALFALIPMISVFIIQRFTFNPLIIILPVYLFTIIGQCFMLAFKKNKKLDDPKLWENAALGSLFALIRICAIVVISKLPGLGPLRIPVTLCNVILNPPTLALYNFVSSLLQYMFVYALS